jgi:hypothetical protein
VGTPAHPCQGVVAAIDPALEAWAKPDNDPKVRALELDRATVEMLEARARARGLTVAELLTEFAAAGTPVSQDWAGLRVRRD